MRRFFSFSTSSSNRSRRASAAKTSRTSFVAIDCQPHVQTCCSFERFTCCIFEVVVIEFDAVELDGGVAFQAKDFPSVLNRGGHDGETCNVGRVVV